MKYPVTAGLLLVVGMACSYGWYWVPAAFQADAWNILTSALVVVLLSVIALAFPSYEVIAVSALLAGFKLLVAGCSIWFLLAPWPIEIGQPLCSAGLNAPLGVVGLILAALLVTELSIRDRNG